MKRFMIGAAAFLLAGTLSSCAGAFPWDTQGDADPDVVVYNDSTAVIGSITVSTQQESRSVSLADGSPLERGESYGFYFVDGGRATVELWDLDGNPAGRCQVDLEKRRVYVTLEDHGHMTAGTAAPWFQQGGNR